MGFDSRQRRILLPLLRAKAIVHVPFFANTFPLGVHYLWALHDKPQLKKEMVIEHSWSDKSPIAILPTGETHVYYAAEATKLADTNRFKCWMKPVFYTYYEPLFFFFKYSVGLSERVKSECIEVDDYSEEWELTRPFVHWMNTEYDYIEIFTDIPGQAGLLRTELKRFGFKKDIRIVADWFDAFSFSKIGKRRLEAFFYGAPTTAAFRKTPSAAIAFRIKVSPDQRHLFHTYVCVVSRDNGKREAIADAITKYHCKLIETAEHKPSSLRDVWWAYNRYAVMRQHRSVFPGPEEYARCLLEHHHTEERLERRGIAN